MDFAVFLPAAFFIVGTGWLVTEFFSNFKKIMDETATFLIDEVLVSILQKVDLLTARTLGGTYICNY